MLQAFAKALGGEGAHAPITEADGVEQREVLSQCRVAVSNLDGLLMQGLESYTATLAARIGPYRRRLVDLDELIGKRRRRPRRWDSSGQPPCRAGNRYFKP